MKKIITYCTPTCAYCKRAKDFLKELGHEYEEVGLVSNL
ncbi:MAG: glutaredoxin domain-containing protein [Candidatus Magasanikbacteria bacterium]